MIIHINLDVQDSMLGHIQVTAHDIDSAHELIAAMQTRWSGDSLTISVYAPQHGYAKVLEYTADSREIAAFTHRMCADLRLLKGGG